MLHSFKISISSLAKEVKPASVGFFPYKMMRCMCLCVSIQLCLTIGDPWTTACQISLSMEFSRQEYCSVLPFELMTNETVLETNQLQAFLKNFSK